MRGVVLAVGLAFAAGAETWQVVPGSEMISAPYDAVQTPDGYLWVSAGVQVYRYDGRRFVGFGEAEGLVARGVTYLAVEPGGTWLAGSGAGLYRLEGGRFRQILLISHNRRVWAQADHQIFVAKAENGRPARLFFDDEAAWLRYQERRDEPEDVEQPEVPT